MNDSKLILPLVALGILACGTLSAAADDVKPVALPPASTKQGVTFANDIKPLFEASCVKCHSGPRAKSKLHLDTLEGVLAGSSDGKVLTPGDSAGSKLVIAVSQTDPDLLMPPKPRKPKPGAEPQSATNQPPPPKPLTAEEVGLVRAWIDQGAK